MFPLPLLPTIPDDLERMQTRCALPYQNSFMKNALIRALNSVYDSAPRIKPSHPAFRPYMGYIEVVCDVATLHIQGDEVFSKSLSRQCSAYQMPSNRNASMAQAALGSLRRLASDWKQDGRTYQGGPIQSCLNGMVRDLIEVFHKQVPRFTEGAIPTSISDEKILELITENMVWLTSNSDITILLPFCMGHHDVKTSKYWPPVNPDAFKVMPELAKQHSSLWMFAPFDPVTRHKLKSVF